MSAKRKIYERLSRGQFGKSLIARARSSALKRRGEPTKVTYDHASAGWIHDAAAGILVLPEPRGRGVNEFDEMTQEVFLKHYVPKAGETVLDVGAGVGTEALTFARLVGETGRVLAIEAHPTTFGLLSKTAELNGLLQLEVLQAAVMDTSQPVTMSDLGPDQTHVNKVGAAGVTVPAVVIADLMEERGLERIDFLKMNIEGAETAALRGAGARLADISHMAIGCHDFLADESGDESYRTKADVQDILQSAGFTVIGRDNDPRPWARDYLFAWR